MGIFRQTRLPKNYQKKVHVIVETPVRLRRYTQRTLPDYWSCGICLGPRTHEQSHTCCEGLTWCFECDWYMWGNCPICQKDTLNTHLTCDICWNDGNMMTVRKCRTCDMMVCEHCSMQNQYYHKLFHFCSMRHYSGFMTDVTSD